MDLIHKAGLCNSKIHFSISSLAVEAYLVNLSLGNQEWRLSAWILWRNTMKREHFQNNFFFLLLWYCHQELFFLLGTFPSNCFGVNGTAVPLCKALVITKGLMEEKEEKQKKREKKEEHEPFSAVDWRKRRVLLTASMKKQCFPQSCFTLFLVLPWTTAEKSWLPKDKVRTRHSGCLFLWQKGQKKVPIH